MMWPSVLIVFVCAIIGLLFGGMWFKAIIQEDPGQRGWSQSPRPSRKALWPI